MDASADSGKPISSAEQKKLRKAEKAARREEKKSSQKFEDDEGASKKIKANAKSSDGKTNVPARESVNQKIFHSDQNRKMDAEIKATKIAESRGNAPQRRASVNASEGAIGQLPKFKGAQAGTPNAFKEHNIGRREVALFGHLYGHGRRMTIDGAPKEVHPSVLALGLQMSSYAICGSNARCVAMLNAFKTVCNPT